MTGSDLARTLHNLSSQQKNLQALSPFLQPELGELFEALAKSSKDLSMIADFCSEFPQQSTTEVVKTALKLFANEQKSVPKLVQRVRALREGKTNGAEQLHKDLKASSAANLKAVVKSLGGKANGKEDALVAVDCFLRGEPIPEPPDPNAQKIEQAFKEFLEIRDQIDSLSIDEIRSRFLPIKKQSKPVLEGLAQKLGRNFSGNKSEIVNQLLGILEGIKGSRVQTELIGTN